MLKRRLGRTNHESTIAIFGTAAFYEITQQKADKTMELVISSGINHIDVAPGYGQAEERVGPWIERERNRFFLGCKTMMRTRISAYDELRHSLDVLRTDSFDLYQFHAVCNMNDLNQITGPDGAMEGVLKAKEEGLLKYIGITGHGLEVPTVFLEAINRFNFDTVLFPINFILYANAIYRQQSETLLSLCRERDIGTMIIKSIARGSWGETQKTNTTWYQPFTESEWIRNGTNFALSQPVTGICTAADVSLLPEILDSCEQFTELTLLEQEQLINQASDFEPLFT